MPSSWSIRPAQSPQHIPCDYQSELDMADIDRISRKVPCVCKVAPATAKYHMEDVHRAGGVMGILGGLFPAVSAARLSPIEAMRG